MKLWAPICSFLDQLAYCLVFSIWHKNASIILHSFFLDVRFIFTNIRRFSYCWFHGTSEYLWSVRLRQTKGYWAGLFHIFVFYSKQILMEPFWLCLSRRNIYFTVKMFKSKELCNAILNNNGVKKLPGCHYSLPFNNLWSWSIFLNFNEFYMIIFDNL